MEEPLDKVRRADIAVVGLGAIGLPVCLNLTRANFTVQVWNRSPEPVETARNSGAFVAADPTLIDAPIVLVVLPDTPQIDQVLDQGLRSALRSGDLLVILSTISPVDVRRLATDLSRDGVRVVDAPVSGGDVGAQQGTLSVMVGAATEDFAACQPVLEAIGALITHLGPVGSGALAKMANQIIVGATLAALGEALELGRAGGLDDDALLDVLAAGMAGSRSLDIKRGKLVSGDFTPGGAAYLQLKDLNHALATAAAYGAVLPVTTIVQRLYQKMIDNDLGHLDHSAVLLTLRTLSAEQEK